MMSLSEQPAKQSGADGALWLSTIAFTACFAVWTIFSIIGVQIQQDLGLSETQFGLLIGTPILTGSLIRLVLGVWTDQFGGRLVYLLVMLAAAAATFLLSYAETYPQFLLAALGVGIAGGSFAVGITYVSKFYPADNKAPRLAFSAPAMSAPPSPSSSRRSCCLRWAGKPSRNIGQSHWSPSRLAST